MSEEEPLDGERPGRSRLPVAEGVRLTWSALPRRVHAAVDRILGSPVVRAEDQRGGFSPGAAARVVLADGRRAFVKSAGLGLNLHTPGLLRSEAAVVAALPADAPVSRLLGVDDDGDWVTLVLRDEPGRTPALPWRAPELRRVLAAVDDLHDRLTPWTLPGAPTVGELLDEDFGGWQRLAACPGRPPGVDDWSWRHRRALADLTADWADRAAGDTLLHLDLRSDNILLDGDRVTFVDWPYACRGAPVVDLVVFLNTVAAQGGPPPEEVLRSLPTRQRRGAGPGGDADPGTVTRLVACVAGYYTWTVPQPPPPGLPTVRAFQAAHGRTARAWLRTRTGLT